MILPAAPLAATGRQICWRMRHRKSVTTSFACHSSVAWAAAMRRRGDTCCRRIRSVLDFKMGTSCPTPVPPECLKDLQRMLREDGARLKLCRRKLGSHMVAATNLAPIISQHASNSDVVFNACACVYNQPTAHSNSQPSCSKSCHLSHHAPAQGRALLRRAGTRVFLHTQLIVPPRHGPPG